MTMFSLTRTFTKASINEKKIFEHLNNGCCMTHTGMRQVAFTVTGVLRDVVRIQRSGYVPNRGSVQLYDRSSDTVVRAEWNRKTSVVKATLADGKEMSFDVWKFHTDEDVRGKLSGFVGFVIPEEIFGFLLDGPTNRQSSVLPGVTESLEDIAKRERLGRFMTTYGLVFSMDEAMCTPKAYLNLKPRDLDFDPSRYVGTCTNADGVAVNISQAEHWYGVKYLGSTRFTVPITVPHNDRYISAHDGRDVTVHTPIQGIPNWERYDLLIRITDGAVIRNHWSSGCGIDVWRIKQQR